MADEAARLLAWLLSEDVAMFAGEADLRARAGGLLELPSFAALAALSTEALEFKCNKDVMIAFDLFDKIQDCASKGGPPPVAAPQSTPVQGLLDPVDLKAAVSDTSVPVAVSAALASAPVSTIAPLIPAPASTSSPASGISAAPAPAPAPVDPAAGSVPDIDAMKARLFSEFGHVDKETIIDMLISYGDEAQVHSFLSNFPKPGENDSSDASPSATPEKKKGWFASRTAIKKAGKPKILPGERRPEEVRVFKKLRAVKDFASKDDAQLYDFAKTLIQPLRLADTYFTKKQLEAQYEDGQLPPDDINAAKSQLGGVTGDELERRLLRMWRVKLILTSLNLTSLQRFAGMWKTWRFGMVHAAVQVGPVVLEWNGSSVVIPTPVSEFTGTHVLLALDLGMLPRDTGFVDSARITDVCKTVCRWNIHNNYSVVSKNCQHFVMDIVQALGLPAAKMEGELSTFINQLSSGHDENKVEFTYKGRVFRTHAELDSFVSSRIDELSDEDYTLLKAYDRAFWIRYRTLVDSLDLDTEMSALLAQCQPFDRDKCPFKDPAETGTIG